MAAMYNGYHFCMWEKNEKKRDFDLLGSRNSLTDFDDTWRD